MADILQGVSGAAKSPLPMKESKQNVHLTSPKVKSNPAPSEISLNAISTDYGPIKIRRG